MRIDHAPRYDFKDVLIRPKRSSLSTRKEVDLQREYTFLHGGRWKGIPVVAANMSSTGSVRMADTLASVDMCTALNKHYEPRILADYFCEHTHWNRVFYTLGSSDRAFDKLEGVASEAGPGFPDLLCLDVANGYSPYFEDAVRRLRKTYPNSIIMAGNVATPELVHILLSAGADIVKIGIGPGSSCTTRLVTGCGYPQLSAIAECADAAHGANGHICADGGCVNPGDICKAFGAGADFVMIGGMLAGTEECDGSWEEDSLGKRYFSFFGMSSKNAMEQFYGGVAEHRAAEGKCVRIPSKGSAINIAKEILGGLRSCCTLVGATRLKDLSKCCTFIRVSQQENPVFNDYVMD